jgi:pimeloyl-ACP methyl ester carboxylesterase
MKNPQRRDIRTNVRLLLGRAGFTLLARVAPRTAEAMLFERFARPRRSAQPRPPEVPGHPAHRFVIQGGPAPLVAWDWGEGPTVLLAHGWGGHVGQLTAFVPPLVAAGFHVVAFDQPAHGHSPGRRATAVDFARAVTTVARRLAPVHGVVAHSLGAIATVLAVSEGLPIQRVVLLAPPVDPAPFAHGFARALGAPPAVADAVAARARQVIADAYPTPTSSAGPRALVFHDPDDPEVPFSHGERVAALWPATRLFPTPGLGHRKLLRDRQVIDAAVAFLSGREHAVRLTA